MKDLEKEKENRNKAARARLKQFIGQIDWSGLVKLTGPKK